MADDSKNLLNLKMPISMQPNKTPVSVLQELSARRGITPRYDLLQMEGMLHEPTFVYRVTVDSFVATGHGTSKKKAKHIAAKAVLEKIIQAEQSEQSDCGLRNSAVPSGREGGSLKESGVDSGAEMEQGTEDVSGNPVGRLQEICLLHRLPPPTYQLCEQSGQPHERTFHIVCSIGTNFSETGIGNTKRLAKRRASHQMIQHLKEVELPSDVCTADDDDTDGIEQLNKKTSVSSRAAGEVGMSLGARQLQQLNSFHSKLRSSVDPVISMLRGMSLDERECSFNVSMLQELANEQNFDVTWIDIDELSISGQRQCLVQLTTAPVIVCFGSAVDVDSARLDAARNALNCLRIIVAA